MAVQHKLTQADVDKAYNRTFWLLLIGLAILLFASPGFGLIILAGAFFLSRCCKYVEDHLDDQGDAR